MATLTVPEHHVRLARHCARCGSRVYRYSDELLDSGLPTGRHFCSACTRVAQADPAGVVTARPRGRPLSRGL